MCEIGVGFSFAALSVFRLRRAEAASAVWIPHWHWEPFESQGARAAKRWTHPNSPPGPGEAPHPAPSARKSVIRLHRKLPSAPPGSTQEVSDPKIGQQLGAQPTPRFRGMLDALHDALHDALLDA